ncbi:hypothetical protein [Methylotenera sp. 1P/1]|uniref:hypothetical protein n=1 Tax=Methylotenera sp. 1P/1 TaxID=1131551 RepID=UPI0003796C07|nr:hypothetical protein [Methylotenera sp. 1P/1]
MTSNSNDDCIEFDKLVTRFLLMIEHEEYREAKQVYDQLRIEYKEAEDFLDEYISTIYEGCSDFEFDNIAQNLARRIEALDLYELLLKVIPRKASVKKIKI